MSERPTRRFNGRVHDAYALELVEASIEMCGNESESVNAIEDTRARSRVTKCRRPPEISVEVFDISSVGSTFARCPHNLACRTTTAPANI